MCIDLKAALRESRPLQEWILKCQKNNRKPKWKDLLYIDRREDTYGYWSSYQDIDGVFTTITTT